MEPLDYEILIKFLLAGLWGGIVGAEREYRSKSAGFRTMIMISVGSCFFTMITLFLGDDGRVAANIVTGIGFLGAGVISRSDNRVNGITTAATIWTVAAVGMGIGAGHYFASALGSLLVILVLAVLPMAETVIESLNRSLTYNLTLEFTPQTRGMFEKFFKDHKLKPRLVKEVKSGHEIFLSFDVVGKMSRHEEALSTLQADSRLRRLERY